jgi:hypothetical protein
MAGTYYKYAERNVESQINWAEVGKNLTDMLSEEAKVREEKKAAIDEATRKFGETLANSPQGEHAGVNQWALNYASDAQEARLIQDRLLRSGQLKLRDYNIMRQNVTDGTKNAFNLFKEYQDEYKVKMERAKSMDPKTSSQFLEQWEMEQAEGFANFSKTKLYINPTNGQVSVGKMVRNEETGVMELSKNPNDFVTIDQMRNRLKSKYDKYDVDANASQWAKGLAKFQREIKVAGGMKKITDPSLRKEFDAAFDAMLKAQLEGNPYNTTSILTDYLGSDKNGNQYTFTYDEAEAAENPNEVLLKPDPTNPGGSYIPDFSTANGKIQYEAAKDYMKTQTIVKLERLEDFQQGPQIQEWQYKIGQDAKKQEEMSNMLAMLYSGDNKEVTSAISFFNGLPGGVQVNRTADGVSFTMKDKEGKETTKTVPFKAGAEEIGVENFIKGASSWFLGETSDPASAQRAALKVKGKTLNPLVASSQATTTETEDPMKQYAAAVDSKSQGLMSGDWNEESVAEEVNNQFGGIGFSARVPYTYGDYIEITSPDGKKSPEIDLSKPNAKQVIADFIKGNIQGESAEEKMRNAYQIISTGTLGGGTQGGTPAAGDAIFGK